MKVARAKQAPVRSSLGLPIARGRPLVTLTLIGINVAIFFLGPALWGEAWTSRLGLVPAWGLDYEPWRLVISGFAHIGLAHLLFNMFALFQFGTVVETLLGRLRFGLVYGLSLLGGGFMILALGEPYSIHVGASGAIFGLLAAFVVLSLALRRPAYDIMALGGLWLMLGFVIDGVSWEGHLGGAVTGAVSALVITQWGKRSRSRPRRR